MKRFFFFPPFLSVKKLRVAWIRIFTWVPEIHGFCALLDRHGVAFCVIHGFVNLQKVRVGSQKQEKKNKAHQAQIIVEYPFPKSMACIFLCSLDKVNVLVTVCIVCDIH